MTQIQLNQMDLRVPSEVTSLFAEAGFKSPKIETHKGAARYPSLEAFVHSEIDGWVLKGQVDVEALLSAM